MRPRKPVSSRTTRCVSISTMRMTRSSQTIARRLLSRWSRIWLAVDGRTTTFSRFVLWKLKNCLEVINYAKSHCKGIESLTFNVPSSVHAMTTRSKESLARPTTARSFLLFPKPRSATPSGAGPILNVLRLIPDCMFHIWITPVEEPARPKLPHALTQTAW